MLTPSEVNLILIFLGAILAVLGYIGRQQIRWMSRIEDKVNELQIKQAVISAIIGVKYPEREKE